MLCAFGYERAGVVGNPPGDESPDASRAGWL
jgi:hypothetical protein